MAERALTDDELMALARENPWRVAEIALAEHDEGEPSPEREQAFLFAGGLLAMESLVAMGCDPSAVMRNFTTRDWHCRFGWDAAESQVSVEIIWQDDVNPPELRPPQGEGSNE